MSRNLMFCNRVSVVSLLCVCLTGVFAEAGSPIVSSVDRFHKELGEQQSGEILLGELGCVACHKATDQETASISQKQAPILSDVSSRVKATHLAKFIANPQETKAGTTMPNLFHGKPDAAAVDALVHYLMSQGSGEPPQALPSASARARGESLFGKVGCVACHGAQSDETKSLASSKPLGDVAGKYTLISLAEFLKNPHHTRPSGRMPGLNLTTREATDIAAFLLPDLPAKSGITWAMYKGSWDKLPKFGDMKPVETGDTEVISVNVTKLKDNFGLRFEGVLPIDVAGEYKFYTKSDDGSALYVNDTKVVDNDGVHGEVEKNGTIKLEPGQYAITVDVFEKSGGEAIHAHYEGPGIKRQPLADALLAGGGEVKPEDLSFTVDASKAAKGKSLFQSLGCASCHEMKVGDALVTSTLSAKPLIKLNSQAGCLAQKPAANVPGYSLNDFQRAALQASLSAVNKAARKGEAVVQRTMAIFNCYACHARGELGGVEQPRLAHFQTTQPEMGVEGSIPPHLNGVGAKLTTTWLEQIMGQGAKDRPYMHARMPKFGTANVGHLPKLLEKLDATKPLAKLDVKADRDTKKQGWQLVGTKGFSCIKCHTFGRFKATGVQSIDMTIMHKRLREDWFRSYIRDPKAYRSDTRMPSAWPAGINVSMLPKFMDGSPEKQIQAVWHYLADGVRARTPEGLVTDSMELIPSGEAIIYRNFIEGAGPRAIGVGYPEGISLAFDANNLRLAMIWQGAFIDAKRHWTGRGQGFEGPAGQKVQKFTEIVPFAALENADASWPTDKARELENHKFKGYRLTEDQRPTFMYQIGDAQITDFPNPVEDGANVSLVRTISIQGGAKNLYFRAATGDIKAMEDGWYEVGDIRMQVEGGEVTIRDGAGGKELIVSASGNTSIKQTYVW